MLMLKRISLKKEREERGLTYFSEEIKYKKVSIISLTLDKI